MRRNRILPYNNRQQTPLLTGSLSYHTNLRLLDFGVGMRRLSDLDWFWSSGMASLSFEIISYSAVSTYCSAIALIVS